MSLTANHLGGSTSSQTSHFYSLEWVWTIQIVPLLHSQVAIWHFKFPTVTYYVGSAFSQMFHCYLQEWLPIISGSSQVWLCVIPTVPLLLTVVTPCGFKYHIIVHWDSSTWSELSHCNLLEWLFVIPGFSLSHRSNCHLLWWLSVVPGVLLLLTLMALHCLRCLTTDHLGHFVSFQVSHFHLQANSVSF